MTTTTTMTMVIMMSPVSTNWLKQLIHRRFNKRGARWENSVFLVDHSRGWKARRWRGHRKPCLTSLLTTGLGGNKVGDVLECESLLPAMAFRCADSWCFLHPCELHLEATCPTPVQLKHLLFLCSITRLEAMSSTFFAVGTEMLIGVAIYACRLMLRFWFFVVSKQHFFSLPHCGFLRVLSHFSLSLFPSPVFNGFLWTYL